jgi:hypothetical protein
MQEVIAVVNSKEGKPIRITKSIWRGKILAEHQEFAADNRYLNEVQNTIEDPEFIMEGWSGERLALRWCEIAPKGPKHLCVVYRELEDDGFVITAFFISRFEKLTRRRNILWQKNS